MIDINSTLFVQVIIFISLMIILNKLLFQPVLRFLEARREKIQGDEAEASRLESEAEQKRLQFDGELSDAKSRALEEKEHIIDSGVAQARSTLEKLQKGIDAEIPKMKAQIEAESDQVLGELEHKQDPTARQIAERILGRSIK